MQIAPSELADKFGHKVVPHIYGDLVPKSQFQNPTNKRTSTRYTWWSFLPITLALQFLKVVNIFYTVTAILQCIKAIRTNNPLATVIPLLFVICLGILKELLAEIKRLKEDNKTNAVKVVRMKPRQAGDDEIQFEDITLAGVQVGDIVKISDKMEVPADCILLRQSKGRPECFVKTSSLDGERNLKPKLVHKAISANFDQLTSAGSEHDTIPKIAVECIKPLKEMYTFDGKIRVINDGKEEILPLDLNQFLHRGSTVENSDYVLGLVIYTGVSSKLIMNLGQYVFKRSRFERILNIILIFNLCLAIVFAIITTVGNIRWTKENQDTHEYIFFTGYKDPNADIEEVVVSLSLTAFKAFFSFYLIVNSFVPLDLLVGIELSKLIYTPYFEGDAEMMEGDPALGEIKKMRANTLSLHEELGQVEYIFCDKTGTLTQNELVFRGLSLQNGDEFVFDAKNNAIVDTQKLCGQSPVDQDSVTNFFRCVALCHDCISIVDGDKVAYNGPSVDEVTLLDMSREAGICYFNDRDSTHCRITCNGKIEEYEIMKIFKFDSVRKAMSVIIKTKEGKVLAFTKGADSSVFPWCTRGSGKDAGYNVDKVEVNVENMARKGLRTLLYGMKEMKWDPSRNIDDLEVEEVECNLTLLAATGVEDLLQENVKECIVDFRNAGISVWMLTGDKGLTAKEIGVSCGLIPQESNGSEEVNAHTEEDISRANHTAMEMNVVDTEQASMPGAGSKSSKCLEIGEDYVNMEEIYDCIKTLLAESKILTTYQVMVSGFTIAQCLEYVDCHKELSELMLAAESVVVYRASPGQKAEVVNFIKLHAGKKVTLAIGDGANDVNMIQQAHIGFGLMGKEGNQAAAFADYALPRFEHLRRALFWHGRPYGNRLIQYVGFCLFKSMINSTTKYAQQFCNGYSGHQPVAGMLLALFNVTMTVWFLLWQLIHDQDVSFSKYGTVAQETNLPYKMSDLYAHSRYFQNRRRFLYQILAYDLYSVVCGIIIFAAFYYTSSVKGGDGQIYGLFSYGFYATFVSVAVHHVQLYMHTRNWTWWLMMWFAISIILTFATIYMGQMNPAQSLWRSIYSELFSSGILWLSMIFATATCCLPLYAAKQIRMVIKYPQFFTRD